MDNIYDVNQQDTSTVPSSDENLMRTRSRGLVGSTDENGAIPNSRPIAGSPGDPRRTKLQWQQSLRRPIHLFRITMVRKSVNIQKPLRVLEIRTSFNPPSAVEALLNPLRYLWRSLMDQHRHQLRLGQTEHLLQSPSTSRARSLPRYLSSGSTRKARSTT